MNEQVILTALDLSEDKDWEFKSAKGGLPGSLWETYSAMANTDGGTIVLGIRELDDFEYEIQGLEDSAKLVRDFWNTVNNRGKVNSNLLTNDDVREITLEDKVVLSIRVPPASRRQRPIYTGQNPLEGTYRRFNDGDYKCSDDEVRRMLSDQSERSADSRILSKFTMHDVDLDSLIQYRNRFRARNSSHPWLSENDQEFLRKLGGWSRDRESSDEGLTVAGLLMFGTADALSDATHGLKFQLDYRERVSDSIGDRWNDRLTIDGTWIPNLFQFFQRVYPKLIQGLKLPFSYQTSASELWPDPLRSGMSPTHEAIQEGLVNALVHADYQGQGGIVIDRFTDRFELSNPGTLLVSLEQLRRGAVSECRNPFLQQMFLLMGAGDRAGSGIDKIRQGWQSQQWRTPQIGQKFKPDRVSLILRMISLLPDDSVSHLQARLGKDFASLDGREVQALVTADVEGNVSNQRLQQFSQDHTTDITRMLQGLVAKGLLVKEGYGRWASYQLASRLLRSGHSEGGTPDISSENSGHNEPAPDIEQMESTEPDDDSLLLVIAKPARERPRLNPDLMHKIIRELCLERYLTLRKLADLLNREAGGLQRWTLRQMVQEGELLLQFPDNPNHPKQAYRTNPDWREQ